MKILTVVYYIQLKRNVWYTVCKQCGNEEFQRTFIIFWKKKFAKGNQRKNTIIPGHSIVACVGTVDCDVPETVVRFEQNLEHSVGSIEIHHLSWKIKYIAVLVCSKWWCTIPAGQFVPSCLVVPQVSEHYILKT